MTDATNVGPQYPNGPTTARTTLLTGPRTSHVVTADLLAPGPNDVLIQVTRCGVCAGEFADWNAGPAGEQSVTIGHEPVGTVIDTGLAVEHLSIGDMVTGRLEHCFADVACAPATHVIPVPTGVSGDAAIGEPLGCVVDALRRTPVDTGDRSVVIGLGFMGLCLLELLSIGGMSELIATDPRPDARKNATTRGATGTYHPAEISGNSAMAARFDVVFEASGTQPGLDLAASLVREHGTLCVLGYHQGTRQIDMQLWNWKAITVINGHVRDQSRLTDSTRRGLALVAAGKIDYASLFTHHYTLDSLDRAFIDLGEKPTGFVKAVVLLNPEPS
jgi:threonine dehydrogenase-like Zn-dependent dehydrogenase